MEWGMWVAGWVGDRRGVTLSFLSIVLFRFTTPSGLSEGLELKNIWNGLLKA